MGRSIKLFSVILLISVIWEPAYSDQCSLACVGSPSTPGYQNGHSYNYGVEGTVTVFLTGADKQETSVKLVGDVSVTAIGNCVHELQVRNLIISGPNGKRYPSPPGIDKPVRFSMQDGRVGPEICSEEGDIRRSLNIKRAIISLLQTEQKPSTQVDVFGACPTDVSSSQEGASMLVHRTRDLSRCALREQGKNDLLTAIYNPTAEIKDTQVLQSSLGVESKVKNGVPEKVVATEEYLYRPFSIGENGARAKVYTKLTMTGQGGAANKPSHCTESRTIIFESPHGATIKPNNFDAAYSAVRTTAQTLNAEAGEKSAGLFAQLVRVLRTTDKNDLMKIYQQCKTSHLEKRVFLDALLRAGTGYSIEASIEILKHNELSDLEQKLVYLSLGNSRHVNNEAMKAVASLDRPNLPKEVYLGIGALAGTYCREHDCHSGNVDGVVAITQKLMSKMQNCKAKTKVEEDNIIAVLKGIRSIRHLENSMIDKLVHCITDKTVRARVKVAALEAFHADPCAAKVKKSALDLMKNRQLDSEIRIKAYLAVIECPCSNSANEIKNLLETEPVHQVGRFITTSLRHIRSSANPDKRLAREHYGLISTPRKFGFDDRKYSFYREYSFNIDALGLGANVDETVIYSQDSFLPRSITLNLTTEVFGHNLNVLELGYRQGNLDRVLEHFLGPKGVFKTQTSQKIYDQMKHQFQESQKKTADYLNRGRRSIKTDIDSFDKGLKAESVPYNNELDLDIFVKLFGTDAIFLSLGDDKGFNFNNVLEELLSTTHDNFNKLKQLQQEFRAHMLFLDAELTYPTSTGLPLKLDLVGSATARVDVAAKVDLFEILKLSKNTKFDIKVVPSTDIEVSGMFLIDADSITTGLKVITNVRSSTGSHVIFKLLEDGSGFDLQLGLPVEKQTIVSASNDLVYFTAEKGDLEKHIPLKTDSERKEYHGCFDQLSGVLGLTFCGEVSVPFTVNEPGTQAALTKFFARYPLSGSSRANLVVEKNDLRGYHIKGSFKSLADRKSFDLLLDAEGSQNRRTHLTGAVVYCPSEYSAKLALDSPVKALSGEIGLYNTDGHLLRAKAKVDHSEYFAQMGVTISGDARHGIIKPLIEFQMPGDKGKQAVKIDGHIVKEVTADSSRYTLKDIKLVMPGSNDAVEVLGHLYINKDDSDFDFNVKDKVTLKGSLKKNDLTLEFQNSLNPYVNFKLNGHSEFGETIRNELDLLYGDLRDNRNRVVIGQFLKYYYQNPDSFNVVTKNKFEIHALPFKVKFDADVDPKKLNVDVEGQYMENKGDFDLEARTDIKTHGDYSVKVIADVQRGSKKSGLEVCAKRDIVSAEKSNFENYIDIKDVARYELSGMVLHKMKTNDMNVGAIGFLKIAGSGKHEEFKFDIGTIENSNLHSSHAKIAFSKGELLNFLLKVTRGNTVNGEMKFNLKDTVAANGQFIFTDKDGKGNGMLIVDFKNAQRKIKSDVNFVLKDPSYNADFDLYFNYEKDNNDKLHFSTQTRRTDRNIDSKNKLEYQGKTTEVNVVKDGMFSENGKTHANVEVVLPTERCLSLKLDRQMTVKDGTYNGNGELTLSDAPKRGGPASTLVYKAKIIDTNIDKNLYNYEGNLKLDLHDGHNLQNTFVFKNVVNGDNYITDFKGDVTGNIIPGPANVQLHSVSKNSLKDVNEENLLKFNYNGKCVVEFIQKLAAESYNPETHNWKYHDDFTLTLNLPFKKGHDIKWLNNVLLIGAGESLEMTLVESLTVDGDTYKVDSNGKYSPQDGSGTFKFMVPHVDPIITDVNYKAKKNDDVYNSQVDVKARYGKGKTANIAVITAIAPRDYSVAFKSSAPQAEPPRKFDFNCRVKNVGVDSYTYSYYVNADNREYKSDTSIVLSKAHPMIDIKYSSPVSPDLSRLYVKGLSLSSSQAKIEIKAERVLGITLDATSESNIQKDHYSYKLHGNCKELGWNNYEVQVSSKDVSDGKRLEFSAVNGGKNVLSGSTSLVNKQEGSKTIFEGSGEVTIQDKRKPASIKYIRTILTEGNEKGVETFFNLAIGERSYVAESRITNMEYKTSYVYCEEKKQCAHAELQSKIETPKPGTIQSLVNAGFDLRKLGFKPEFGLQIKDEVSDKRPPQYTLDLHVNVEDKKYYLHAYNTPEFGNAKSGVTVQLPQRTMGVESSVTYPTEKTLPFPIKADFSVDFDKKRPGAKAAVRVALDMETDDSGHAAVFTAGMIHPGMDKEALINVRGVLTKPVNNVYKVETSATASYAPCGKDRTAKMIMEVSPNHFKAMLDTPFVKVFEIEGSGTIKENLQQGSVKFNLLQGKPVQMYFVVKDFQYYEFTTDETDRKIVVVGHLEPEKRIDISADIVLPKEKKNLLHGAIYLKDNAVKSDYGMSKENFDYYANALQNDLKQLQKRLSDVGERTNNQMNFIKQRAEPSVKKVRKFYEDEYAKFTQELKSDETLNKMLTSLAEVLESILKMIDDVMKATKPIVDQITNQYIETAKKMQEMYEKELEPKLKELYETLNKISNQLLEGLINAVAYFTALVNDFFEKHKAELKELTNTIAEIFKDVTRIVVAQLKEGRLKLAQLISEYTKELKEMPIFQTIKEKWNELAVPEQWTTIIDQFHVTIRDLLPTNELKEFSDVLNNYIIKKLRKEKSDDAKELRVIYQKFLAASYLPSVMEFIRNQISEYGMHSSGYNGFIPFFSTHGGSVPSSSGSATFSALNQLLRGDFPDIFELIKAYRPRSLNIFDEIPAKLRAVVVNGQHIFTFDGRHLTFPGSCRYVLAHDHVDRNFTLAMQLQNGAPKALILEDESGITIELKDNGQVMLNSVAHGFPVIEKDVFAFRQANGRIGLGSLYGLMAFCSPKLEVCYIEVNGYYYAKLRGLLGDGNNEPYDDFRLPSGKISTSEGEFGNAYRLSRSCPQVSPPEHSHHQMHGAMPAACEKVFGGISPLRPVSTLLDVAPFRQACVHACTGDDSLQQACDLARGYTALATTGLIPVKVPDVCLQCTDADKPRNVGEVYEMKLPTKQADIIVTVEITGNNEKNFKEIAVPLVGAVVDSLKSRRINDIKVYLVGITSRFPYPILYDTDLKLKNAKVQFTDRTRRDDVEPLVTGFEKMDEIDRTMTSIVNNIKNSLGLTNVVGGYSQVLDLPLRAGAVKHAISFVGEACTPPLVLFSDLRALAYSVTYQNMAYTHSLVTVTPPMHIGNGKNAQQIVGFSEDSVIMLGDKRLGKDTAALRSTLHVDADTCVDLSIKSDGVVFSATNFQHMNAGQQKQFLLTAASTITQMMTHESLVQECVCGHVDPFRVRSLCVNKDRKELARRRK